MFRLDAWREKEYPRKFYIGIWMDRAFFRVGYTSSRSYAKFKWPKVIVSQQRAGWSFAIEVNGYILSVG
jgi:hypothetical protein